MEFPLCAMTAGLALSCAGPALAASPITIASAEPQIWEQTYSCESGRIVKARYEAPQDTFKRAKLTLDGRTFEMYWVKASSGARYATEQGLKPDRGLQWWVKGQSATLSEMMLDHTSGGPRTIDTCRASKER